MLPNPYAPGELPRVLTGRERQQDRIRAVLARVAAYGEMGGPLTVFQGPRGVGKTSLLRAAQSDAEEHGFVTAWVSCRNGAPFLPDLVSRVDRALERAEVMTKAQIKDWRLQLERLELEVGVPAGVKVKAALDRVDAPVGPQMSMLEDLLHTAAAAVRDRGGAGLVLFVDELHAPAIDDLAVFLNLLQNLAGKRTENPLAVFGAGLPSTSATLTKAATFGERSSFVTLPRLDAASSEAAVRRPADELAVRWAPEAVDLVVEEAQGYPYLLQVLAYAVWESVSPEAGGLLAADDVAEGRVAAADQLRSMYEARWASASSLEQDLMRAMAELGPGPVSRADVAAKLGRASRSLSVPRDRLIDKGIVEPTGRGMLQFTLPGFEAYVASS